MPDPFRIGLVSLYVFENNGVRYLAAALRERGVSVTEVYLKDYVHHRHQPPTERELDLLVGLLEDRQVDLVGLSVRAGAYLPVAREVTDRVRRRLGRPVLWGGPHVSMAPDDCLPHADMLVLGEAEEAICDVAASVARGADAINIPNVWAMRDGHAVRNPLRLLRQDLDALPFRDFHSVTDKFWIRDGRLRRGEPMAGERIFPMLTSRGCLYNCAYCDVNSMRRLYDGDAGPFFRWRSVGNCLDELEQARATFPRMRRVRFDDELFVPYADWINEFARTYPARIGLPFDVLSDPRCLDEASIAALAGAGMDQVFVGLQASESANRRLYNRPVTDARVLETARTLRRHGVYCVFQVIVDDPETRGTEKRELLDLLLELPRPYGLYMFSLGNWPGTERTRSLLERGLATPEDVEGKSNKVLTQFLAEFGFPRPAEDRFFLALYELANKRLVPRAVIRWLARSDALMRRPGPLVLFARKVNLFALVLVGLRLLRRGELSANAIRRWFSAIASPSV